jgi:hypothetical protein
VDRLEASNDAKVRQFVNHLNSTGHRMGKDYGCVEATQGEGGCEPACYTIGPMNYYKFVEKKLLRNLKVLNDYSHSTYELSQQIKPLVAHSVKQFDRFLAKQYKEVDAITELCEISDDPDYQEGLRLELELRSRTIKRLLQRGPIFRHHWSGDVMSVEHAKAIRFVAQELAHVSFWIYTRTWWAAAHMLGEPNLQVFLSVDPVNEHIMLPLQKSNPAFRLAYMAPKATGRALVCPATNGKLKSEGSCHVCGICFNPKVDVDIEFLIH